MTDLTFAIEANKRNCPFIDFFDGKYVFTKLVDDYRLTDLALENADKYERFVIGATLAMWWDEQAVANRANWDQASFCARMASVARAFAKGE